MKSGLFELQVCVNGRPTEEYGQSGLTLIEGRKGSRFTLKFRNNSATKVLVIPAIDGLGIIDGNKATEKSRGYIVEGFCATEFEGWRVSLDQVNEFIFKAKSKSYAASKGQPEGAGVIGVMVIAEKPEPKVVIKEVIKEVHHDHYHGDYWPLPVPWRPWRPYRPRPVPYWDFNGPYYKCGDNTGTFTMSTHSSVDGMQSKTVHSMGMLRCASEPVMAVNNAAPALNLGTGWGQARESKVVETEFKRGKVLAVLEVYYSDAAGLREAGIDVTKKERAVSAPVLPRAFSGFCQPPKEVLDEVDALP